MSALKDFPIALNIGALMGPWTGIGQYTLELARALQTLAPNAPWLFTGRAWTKSLPAENSVAGANKVKDLVGRALPVSYKVSRALQQYRFSAGARAHRIGLYHEPNYLAFRFDGPMVVTVHDLSWIRYPGMHPAERVRMMNELMPRVVERATHILVDSDFVRAEVLDHYRVESAKVTSVPLGVSAEFTPLDAAACRPVLEANGLRHGEYILTVGTLEPRKNLATVVKAFRGLPEMLQRRFPLVVVGMSGWQTAQLQDEMRSMSRDGTLRLPGYVPRADLPKFFAGARVFAYPSIYEGFGLPPLEAMACGAPVIVSRSASLPEVVGDAGLMVEALDDAALAEQLRQVIEDDALRERLRAAGPRRASRFTWRRCAEETLRVYELACLAAPPAKSP